MRMLVLVLLAAANITNGARAEGQGKATAQPATEKTGNKVRADHLPATLDLDPKIGAAGGVDAADSFDSRPVGVRQKWQLDKGHFESDERISGVKRIDEATDNYSGIRLRRPRKP